MKIENFMQMVEGSLVKRWHTKETIKTQNNAEHQWNVAMICYFIDPAISTLRLMHALTHDCLENITGDVPYSTKQCSSRISDALKFEEDLLVEKYQLPSCQNIEHVKIIKAADRICAYMFCLNEVSLGNSKMQSIANNIYNDIMVNKINMIDINHKSTCKLLKIINEYYEVK